MTAVNPYLPPQAELSCGRRVWLPEPSTNVGRVVGEGLGLYVRNFGVIGLLTLIVYGPVELAKNLFVYRFAVEPGNLTRIDMIIGAFIGAVLAPAILFAVVEPYRTGQPARLGAAVRYGVDRWAETFRANLLAGLWMVGGLLLLVVPGLVVLVWYAFTDEVVALERPVAGGALPRSKTLTVGHRWSIFFAFLLVGAIYFALALASGMIFAVIDTWWVATAVDLLLDVSYPMLSLVGLALYVRLAHGASGDSTWVERVRWAPPPATDAVAHGESGGSPAVA